MNQPSDVSQQAKFVVESTDRRNSGTRPGPGREEEKDVVPRTTVRPSPESSPDSVGQILNLPAVSTCHTNRFVVRIARRQHRPLSPGV